MRTHNIRLKYRTPKRYPTIISIMPPNTNGNPPWLELSLSRTSFMVPKGFEPSKFDCTIYFCYLELRIGFAGVKLV